MFKFEITKINGKDEKKTIKPKANLMHEPGVLNLNISEMPYIIILMPSPQDPMIKHNDKTKMAMKANLTFNKNKIPIIIRNIEKIKVKTKLIEIIKDDPSSKSERIANIRTVPI